MQEPNVQAHVQSMLRFCFICFESSRVEFVINIVRGLEPIEYYFLCILNLINFMEAVLYKFFSTIEDLMYALFT